MVNKDMEIYDIVWFSGVQRQWDMGKARPTQGDRVMKRSEVEGVVS